MNFFVIVGPGAVGKMSVGQELKKLTGYKLFHNHSAIEPVLEIFDDFRIDMIRKFRKLIFDEFINGDYKGLIYTTIWAFNEQEDHDYIENLYQRCKEKGHNFYVVELYAPLDIRLKRNVTENRLLHKKSKNDIPASNARLLQMEELRCNSYENEIKYENYIKIDNSNLTPQEVAKIIKDKFNLD